MPKKSKFAQSVAHKALMTSSAQRRFRAEEYDPEEHVTSDIGGAAYGSDEFIEKEMEEYLVSLTEEEKQRQRLLLANLPQGQQREGLRRLREARRVRDLARREKEGDARNYNPEHSRYAQEDLEAKQIRSSLHAVVNPIPDERYLLGGPTVQGLGEGQLTPSLEDQVISSQEERSQREKRSVTRSPRRARPTIDETLRRDETVTPGQGGRPGDVILQPSEMEKRNKLLARQAELRKMDSRIKATQQKALTEHEIRYDPVKKRRVIVPNTKEKLRQKVQAEMEGVKQELSSIRGTAIVPGARGLEYRTPAATESLVRQQIDRALAVPDPLHPGSRFRGIRTYNNPPVQAYDEKGLPVPTPEGQGALFRIPVENPREGQPLVPDSELEGLVHHVVKSFHAPTHAERVDAKRKADRLVGRISQRAQAKLSKRHETAERDRIIRELQPIQTVWPVTGVERLSELQRRRRSLESPQLSIFGIRESMARTKPFKDPRVNDITTEDLYDQYGHERIAPRLAWEKRRIAAKFSGEEFTEPAPKPFESIKRQGQFLKTQATARIKGAVTGSEILGVNQQGRAMALPGRTSRTQIGTSPRAFAGVSPNIIYEYKVRNPQKESDKALAEQGLLERLEEMPHTDEEALQKIQTQRQKVEELRGPLTEKVYPTDQKRQFKIGRRDKYGRLLPGEFDELEAEPVVRTWQTTPVAVSLAARQPKRGKESLPHNVDEIRYISTPGAKGETRTVNDPEGTKRVITEIRDIEGEWVEVPREEYDAARAARADWADKVRIRRRQGGKTSIALPSGSAPPEARERVLPRKIQYKYVDPKDLTFAATSGRDIASIKVPGFEKKIGGKTIRRQESLIHLQFSEDPHNPLNKFVAAPLRVHTEATKLEAARTVAKGAPTIGPITKELEPARVPLTPEAEKELREKHGIRDKSEAKLLMEAAAAAGFYSRRDRLMHGQVPNIANKLVSKIPGSEKYNFAFDVNEALIRPSLERAAQYPYMFRHPFSSVTDASGLDVSSIKHRQEKIKKSTMGRRQLELQTKKVQRIGRTAEFVKEHHAQRGPIGTYTRWKLEALQRSPDYQFDNDQSAIEKALEAAHTGRHEGVFEYYREKTRDPHAFVPLDARGMAQAEKLRKEAEKAKAQTWAIKGMSSRLHEQSFLSRAVAHSGSERNLLIGGAAIGTAAGAAYLYHRHQQNKKPEQERLSFYNKVLPPAFNTPRVIPKVRVTTTVKLGDNPTLKELGQAGKELPTQIGVSLHSKRVALRPSDRGYDSNLPLVGRPSFRGTKGGSATKGLKYWGTETPKRTSIRRSTHEVKVLGKKVPGALSVGALRPVQLQTRNPNRMSRTEMEDIIWAHAGTDKEEHVKAFYRGAAGDRSARLLELWESPDDVDRIMRSKTKESREYRTYQRQAVAQRRRVTSAAR